MQESGDAAPHPAAFISHDLGWSQSQHRCAVMTFKYRLEELLACFQLTHTNFLFRAL